MSWQLLSLVNIILGACVVPLQRLLLRGERADPIPFVLATQSLTGAVLIPVAVLHGLQPPDLAENWHVIPGMFALYASGHILYARALQASDASVFGTLLRTSTVWIVATAYLAFDEPVRRNHVAGTGLVVLSVLLLAEPQRGRPAAAGVPMGLAVGVVFGLASSAWIYVGRDADVLTWTAMTFLGTPIILACARPHAIRDAKALVHRQGAALGVVAVAWAGSNAASLAAYQRGPASLVAPTQATAVVLSAVLGIVVLHERTHVGRRLAAALVTCVGVMLIMQ